MNDSRITPRARLLQPLALLASLGLLAGCKFGPDYEKPSDDTPPSWSNDAAASGLTAPDQALARWWSRMGDTKLTALVERALRSSPDMKTAVLRLKAAGYGPMSARAGMLPTLGASGSYSHSHGSGDTDHLGSTEGSWNSGLSAGLAVDVFGGQRRNLESAEAQAEATLEDTRGVRVAITAEVASRYFERTLARENFLNAKENLRASEELLRLIRIKHGVGSAANIDLINAENEVNYAGAAMPDAFIAENRALAALALLLGTDPGSLRRELGEAGPFVAEAPAVQPGIPSSLLRRRPDIRAAERRLHSSTALIGARIADFFPKFSLGGNMGVGVTNIGTNAPSPGLSWSAGPSVSWNIFDSGATYAGYKTGEIDREASYVAYKRTVIAAINETESALLDSASNEEKVALQRRSLESQRKLTELSEINYRQGGLDLTTLVQTKRALTNANNAMNSAVYSRIVSHINLVKALGGGWGEAPEDDVVPADDNQG